MKTGGTGEAGGSLPEITTVAVIGAGVMGHPMACHIHDAGFRLTVCDTNTDVLREFETLGARTTLSPAECAGCDAIIVLVGTVPQFRDVAATIRAAEKGPAYLVVMSTVAPQDMRDVADMFADTATRIVDAPISGAVIAARRGTLTILAGGTDEDMAVLHPLFAAVGNTIFHCGDLGAGQMVKIVNNMIAIGNQYISAEAYSLGLASGLKLERLMPALDGGSARNFLSKDGAAGPRDAFQAWSTSAEDYRAIKAGSLKDLDLALSVFPPEIAHPALTAIRGVLAGAGDETLANWVRVAKS